MVPDCMSAVTLLPYLVKSYQRTAPNSIALLTKLIHALAGDATLLFDPLTVNHLPEVNHIIFYQKSNKYRTFRSHTVSSYRKSKGVQVVTTSELDISSIDLASIKHYSVNGLMFSSLCHALKLVKADLDTETRLLTRLNAVPNWIDTIDQVDIDRFIDKIMQGNDFRKMDFYCTYFKDRIIYSGHLLRQTCRRTDIDQKRRVLQIFHRVFRISVANCMKCLYYEGIENFDLLLEFVPLDAFDVYSLMDILVCCSEPAESHQTVTKLVNQGLRLEDLTEDNKYSLFKKVVISRSENMIDLFIRLRLVPLEIDTLFTLIWSEIQTRRMIIVLIRKHIYPSPQMPWHQVREIFSLVMTDVDDPDERLVLFRNLIRSGVKPNIYELICKDRFIEHIIDIVRFVAHIHPSIYYDIYLFELVLRHITIFREKYNLSSYRIIKNPKWLDCLEAAFTELDHQPSIISNSASPTIKSYDWRENQTFRDIINVIKFSWFSVGPEHTNHIIDICSRINSGVLVVVE